MVEVTYKYFLLLGFFKLGSTILLLGFIYHFYTVVEVNFGSSALKVIENFVSCSSIHDGVVSLIHLKILLMKGFNVIYSEDHIKFGCYPFATELLLKSVDMIPVECELHGREKFLDLGGMKKLG